MERLINRRQQGDLGEASAIEWLTRQGATVSAPLGHSPDYDLVAEIDGHLIRVQVKTCASREHTVGGDDRWPVLLATLGGNQSWSGVAKRFDPAKVDYVFLLVGDGRRWFIPADALEGRRTVRVGGLKHSEFEIEPVGSILPLVYADQATASTIDAPAPGERRSWRAGLGCKPSASVLSGFESLLPHADLRAGDSPTGERRLGRAGQAIVREKRQMTFPHAPFADAGLEIGDRLRFRADGPGRVIAERIESSPSNPGAA